jgi:hypothetical protein
MSHARKAIRDNIVSVLTGLSTTGARVYQSRVYPLDKSKLPGLCIYTKSEQSAVQTMGPNRTVQRVLSVSVEAYVRGVTGYDNSLDDICKEVEVALLADRTRAGLAKDTQITGFSADYSGEGEQPVATGVISVDVTYHTKEFTPGLLS